MSKRYWEKPMTLRLTAYQRKVLSEIVDGAADAGACKGGLSKLEGNALLSIHRRLIGAASAQAQADDALSDPTPAPAVTQSPPAIRASQNAAERDPSVMPDSAGGEPAGKILQIGGAGSGKGWGYNAIEVRVSAGGDGWTWREITDAEKQKLIDTLNSAPATAVNGDVREATIKECRKVAEGFRRQMLPGDDRRLIRKIEDAIAALSSAPAGGTGEPDNAAFQNTDGAGAIAVLAAVRHCANSWDGSARLLGNVRASDIARACNEAIPALFPKGPIHRTPEDGPSSNYPCRELSPTIADILASLLAILDGLNEYQKRPENGDYGVECICCRGEMFDKADRATIESARAGLASLPKTDPELGKAEALRLLRKISDLAYDEDVGEPLDDAIDYANKAIAALQQAPGTDATVTRPDRGDSDA